MVLGRRLNGDLLNGDGPDPIEVLAALVVRWFGGFVVFVGAAGGGVVSRRGRGRRCPRFSFGGRGGG